MSILEKTRTLKSLEDTKKLAHDLATLLKKGDVLTLSGHLGAGKTTLCQFLIRHLGGEHLEVTSPTFNLVHTYEGKDVSLWHFDLYRLKDEEEIFDLGFEDALHEGISLIEWPSRAENFLPSKRLSVTLAKTPEGNREVSIKALGGWTEE